MPICQKCKEEIEHLNNYVSGENLYIFDGDNYNQEGDFIDDNKTNDFECPECSEVLFTDEEKATNFLQNKDELTELVKEKIKNGKKKKGD